MLGSPILSLAAHAQQGVGELRGEVKDVQGAVMPGVAIVARDQNSGIYRETVSGADGSFFLAQMRPGVYEITAELQGFKKYLRRDFRVEVGRTSALEIALEVGALEESITVTAEAPLVDVSTNELGGHVDAQELQDVPSANRNFTGYLALLPGVVARNNPASVGADDIFASGQSNQNVSYTLDGSNNNEALRGGNGGAQARITTESVQEFQLLTSQFDAEFGGSSGAIVNAVSKQGTNQVHGSGFYFFQDASLTSRDYFAEKRNLPKPETQQQQWGGTVGGPIVRDKAHFFFSVERIILDLGRTINIPPRPELNKTDFERARIWNTFLRFDNQLNANHTWGMRWLREASPQKNQYGALTWTPDRVQQENDVDQTIVASLSSVLGTTAVNTFKAGYTREEVYFANPQFFETLDQSALLPTLNYLSFSAQQSPQAFYQLERAYSADEVFSLYVADKGGSHDLKFGVNYAWMSAKVSNTGNMNGTFTFSHNLAFNAADPRTYPDRLAIRVPGAGDVFVKSHILAGFAQDKWKIGRKLSVNLGVRYDLEVLPLPEQDNPRFTQDSYPMDKNNLSPRLGFSYDVAGNGRSVVRGGFGVFFQRTPLDFVDDTITAGIFSTSFTQQYPTNAADPGPAAGRLPDDPMLRNGPVLNRAAINALFPPGTLRRNTGAVFFDSPDRTMPHSRTYSIGYQRQFGATVALSADYVRSEQRDLLLRRNLNPGLRVNTTRTGALNRVDAATFVSDVWELGNFGSIDYDSLQVQLDKRLSRGFSVRGSYTLAKNRGNTSAGQNEIIATQLLDDLALDTNDGPTNFERPHILSLSGTYDVPKTKGLKVSGVFQARSGLPISLIDSSFDLNRNGQFDDEFLPSGTYSGAGADAITVESAGGRNGARAPSIAQLNLRAGYRIRLAGNRSVDAFVDVFNILNRANFAPPTGDRREATFLQLTQTDISTPPRTAQLYVRYGF
jgi:hypothetical protein